MILLAFVIFGVLLGALTARNRGGNRLDILHYVAVYALIFAVLGILVTLLIARFLSG